jgi:hypothetical protein
MNDNDADDDKEEEEKSIQEQIEALQRHVERHESGLNEKEKQEQAADIKLARATLAVLQSVADGIVAREKASRPNGPN